MNGDHPPDCPAYYTPMDVPNEVHEAVLHVCQGWR